MAKTSKKAIGTAMAGVMAVGAVAGAVQSVNVANAAESAALKEATANVDHLISSINKWYAGIKNQSTWELYVKTIRGLIAKIPSAEAAQAAELTKKTDKIADVIVAIGNINHVEKSMTPVSEGGYGNHLGIKNADTWNGYLEVAQEKMKSVDLTVFQAKYDELVERFNKVDAKVEAIIEKHNEDLAAAEALYDAAKKSMKLEDAQKALAAAEALGTHSTSDALEAKVKALIAEINSVPTVTSVSAVNATEIKVVFNKELNKESAETASNYDVIIGNEGATPSNNYRAVLQDDKKTVIIQFGTGSFTITKGIENAETYKVNVKDKKVLTSDYKAIEEYKGVAQIFSDKVNPKLQSATLSGSTLTLTFDERVSSIGSLKVDGVTVPGASYTTTAGKYTVTYNITDADMLKNGSHNISLYSVADYSGNSEVLINSSYVATDNNVKPSVEKVEALSSSKFRVTFASAVNAPVNTNFEVKKGSYTFPASKISTPVQYGTSGKVWDVTINDNGDTVNPLYATGENAVNLSVAVKDYKGTNDVFGDAFTTNVTLVKDTVKPVVQNSAINSVDANSKKITVIFNEELDNTYATSGVDLSKVSVAKDGVRVDLTGASATINSSDKKKVEITLPNGHAVTDGTYTITFAANAVRDLAENGNDGLSTSAVAKVTAGTELAGPTVNVSPRDGKNVLTLTFASASADGMENSAIDPSNYKLDGVPLNSPLYAGTDIAFTAAGNKKVVEIVLPKGQVSSSSYTAVLEVSKNVKDKDGKYVSDGNKGIFTTPISSGWSDDVAPVLKTAEYIKENTSSTSTNALKLTFSENVTATDNEDFLVNVGGTKVNATIISGTSTGEVIIKLATSVNLAQSGTVAITTDKAHNTNGVINIVDGTSNVATAKTVTLSSSIVDNSSYKLVNPNAPAAPSTTFSFDGGNAGKLVGATTAMEYSLNGGTAWTTATANQDLSSVIGDITATNDIKVRVKASGNVPAGAIQTIDISAGPAAPTGLTCTTAQIAGTTAAMEYKLESGVWTDCTATNTAVTIAKDDVLKVRVKATGTTLAGAEATVDTSAL